MNTETDITGVSVFWNTPELVDRSYKSLRLFHPDMKIIIVDGSPKGSACYQRLDDIQDPRLDVYHLERNIGHGRGMNFGLLKVQTPFVLFFDSDIEMVKSPLQRMLDMIENDTYGVGYIELVGRDGNDYGAFPVHKKQKPVKYLHPYFQLVQVKETKRYKPFIHHGAPCITTMLDIDRKNLSNQVLKEFPGLGHTNGCGISWSPCAGEYVKHDVAGFGMTGRKRVEHGLPHIEGIWERVI